MTFKKGEKRGPRSPATRKKPLSVYLAGPITSLTFGKATGWREYVKTKLAAFGIVCYSPMRGKDFLMKRVGGAKVLGQTYDSPLATQKGIVTRDRFDVMNCDVVLFNLLGADKVSIGTVVEFGWCDAFRKVAVVVMETENIHQHAFLKEIAGYIVDNMDEALEIVKTIGGVL